MPNILWQIIPNISRLGCRNGDRIIPLATLISYCSSSREANHHSYHIYRNPQTQIKTSVGGLLPPPWKNAQPTLPPTPPPLPLPASTVIASPTTPPLLSWSRRQSRDTYSDPVFSHGEQTPLAPGSGNADGGTHHPAIRRPVFGITGVMSSIFTAAISVLRRHVGMHSKSDPGGGGGGVPLHCVKFRAEIEGDPECRRFIRPETKRDGQVWVGRH